MTRRVLLVLFVLSVPLVLSACTTLQRHDNAARLQARPDFEQARLAAPEWCRDAIKTINALEYELERK